MERDLEVKDEWNDICAKFNVDDNEEGETARRELIHLLTLEYDNTDVI